MQIQLKQAEIVEALKQYIARQGIGLCGKDVVIGFTSGRKDNGLSADISIEEADLPVIPVEVPKVVLSVVPTPQVDTPAEEAPPQSPVEAAGKSLFG